MNVSDIDKQISFMIASYFHVDVGIKPLWELIERA